MPIPDNYSAPVYLSAKDRAFRQIQEWIIDGTLHAGEKISDIELAKAIGISRTPVREALQILSFQGFLSMKPGVATIVSAVDSDDISKVFPPLAVLEGLAAELAIPVITEKDIAVLRDLNTVFQDTIPSGDAFKALKVDEEFHATLTRLCDNSYLENMITNLQAHVRRLFFQQAIVLTEESVAEHAKLIDALEQHDTKTASYYAKENWLRPIRDYTERNQAAGLSDGT